MRDAELDDVYVDGAGKLWRVVGICGEPTVIAQEVESTTPESPVTMRGGVSGFMWDRWKRIHRPEKKKDYAAQAIASHTRMCF
jgi:hypothetical protein